jgi:hypothetical protein
VKAWITRYALTEGIYEIEAEVCSSISEQMISQIGSKYPQHFHGKDWHLDEAAAVARAEEMRQAKMKSLRKSLANLEHLRFAPKEQS